MCLDIVGSTHKYFVVAKHEFYLEDAIKSFTPLGIELRVASSLEEICGEIRSESGACTVFVPHYSKIINLKSLPKARFIGFHTGDLPQDRGGSPIQHKILKKEYLTDVSAITLEDKVDSGAIYTRRSIDLSQGSIEFILRRISLLISSMMVEIVVNDLKPTPQSKDTTPAKRLAFTDSEIPDNAELEDLYDRIRMVDGLDYPRAYLKQGKYKVSFTNAVKKGERISADAIFEIGE